MDKQRILVIDDDAYIRNACVDFLNSVGYMVDSAGTGESGVEVLKKKSFEIVITDLKLPEMDGLDVLKFVKDNYPATDVIVITAHGTIENAVQAMKLGAYDYVPKTFDITELDLIVKRCFEKRRLSAEISELKELVNLYEVSKAIGSIMGLDELLNLILKLSCDTLNADSGSIMLYEPATDELTVKVALGARKDSIIGKKLVLGERIAGYVAKEHKILSIQGDLKNDPRFSRLEEFESVKSSITSPLMRKDKLLGVINLSRIEKDIEFQQREMKLLSIFAVEAAIAMENTYLFNSLEREKEELNATFTAMADGAVVTDANLKIIRLNNSAKELLDLINTESLSKDLGDMITAFEPSIKWDDFKKSREKVVNFELARKKGKALFLGVLTTKIFDRENNMIGQIFVLRDITEEKKEGKQKIDFLSIISHKLRTPLTAINGFSALLLDKSKDMDTSTRHALEIIGKEGNVLNQLVDKLIRFTLLESEYTELHTERTGIKFVLDNCIQGIQPYMQANKVKLEIDENIYKLPDLAVDYMKIVEVIENVLENGTKFNTSKDKMIRVSGKPYNEVSVVIEISDNGLGIPSEEQKKIFQKFYQIDEYKTGQIEGAGLGLAVVKKILDLHGSIFWVESTIGKGSKFCFTLPLWKK